MDVTDGSANQNHHREFWVATASASATATTATATANREYYYYYYLPYLNKK